MSKKILFIEDEPDQIAMVTIRLQANGFEVFSAMDGVEGLKKVKEIKPDLILLDMLMPRMNGAEVCKRLKENPGTKDIPVIIITASGEKDLEQECFDLGANDLIIKPFESAALVKKVKELIGGYND
jgi:CheY-like chemotaxis protein